MSPLLRKIAGALQGSAERFHCFVPEGKDAETCLQLRKSAFGEKFKTESREGKYFEGLTDAFDAQSTLLACRESRSSVVNGTLRLTSAAALATDAKLQEQFALHQFPEALRAKVGVISRVAIHRDADTEAVLRALLVAAYRTAIGTSTCVLCAATEPVFYPLYRALGFRPLGRVKASPFGGYLLPLFLDMHAYGYFKIIGSPLEEVARAACFPGGDTGRRWYADFIAKNGSIDPGYGAATGGELLVHDSPLTANLTEEGKAQLLKEAITIDCRFGDVVMAQSAGGRTMGFVQRGALEVRKGDRVLAVLGEGDVFGEIAFILGSQRTADVVSASDDTKVVMFDLDVLDHLKGKGDKVEIWKNLARILASRLAVNNPETYIAPPPTGATAPSGALPNLPRG